jgi:hypothetical protein
LEDAERSLKLLISIPFDHPHEVPAGARAHLRRAGHILGAASIQLDWAGATVVFSGDLGRYDDATMVQPVPFSKVPRSCRQLQNIRLSSAAANPNYQADGDRCVGLRLLQESAAGSRV